MQAKTFRREHANGLVRLKTQGFRVQYRVHRSCPLATFCTLGALLSKKMRLKPRFRHQNLSTLTGVELAMNIKRNFLVWRLTTLFRSGDGSGVTSSWKCVLYYIILYYIILYYNILYYIILCYIILYYIIILHYIILLGRKHLERAMRRGRDGKWMEQHISTEEKNSLLSSCTCCLGWEEGAGVIAVFRPANVTVFLN